MLKNEGLDMVNNHIKTYAFIGLVTLASSLMISYSYSSLKILTEENVRFDAQKNIIKSVGVDISKLNKDEILNHYSTNINEIILDQNLNEINDVSEREDIEKLTNYHLDLNLDYALIKVNYSKSLKRKLNKAEKNELLIQQHISPEVFVDFYLKNVSYKIANFKEKHKHTLHRLIYKALSFQLGSVIGVSNKDNQLVAANFILLHPTRVVNLLPCSSKEGNDLNAMPFLIDYLLQRNANNKKIFDFEGSMIEGVSQFYKSFGAEKMTYFKLKKNLLPYYLRIFKN